MSLLLSIVLLLIAAIISLSPAYSPPSQYNADKFMHAAFYCLFALVCLAGIENRSWTKYLAVAMTVFLYGLLLELFQQYIDGRTASVADIGINGIGVALALLIKAASTNPNTGD